MHRSVVLALLLATLALAGCTRQIVTPGDPDATPAASTEDASEEVRLRLLRSMFGGSARLPRAGDEQPAYDAVAFALRYPDREIWVASTSGTRVYEGGGDRKQVAAIYERRGGDWKELARVGLGSTPVTTAIRQLAGPQLRDTVAWIAITGATAARGGTYELLRFDGTAVRSAFWWFSPRAVAGTEQDLDGDGIAEVVLDASDTGALCTTCGVLDISEVDYHWVKNELVPVQIAPLPGSPVEAAVARAIALADAGLWTEAASTIAGARDAAPTSNEVRWMAIVMERVAAARTEQAGAGAQPLLTEVLAGDYAAATARMRRLEVADAFAPDGPLIARTAADGRATQLGAALVRSSTRAIGVRPELADAYLVRALGEYLRDPKDLAPAIANATQAASRAPNDLFARAVVAFLRAKQ